MLGYGQDILECSPVGAFGRESLVKAEFNVERMGVVCQLMPRTILTTKEANPAQKSSFDVSVIALNVLWRSVIHPWPLFLLFQGVELVDSLPVSVALLS